MQDGKKRKIVLASALALLILICGVYSGYQMSVAARTIVTTVQRPIDTLVPETLTALSTSNPDNVFTILEIVPYRGMGEVGYLVGGCEPIDLTKIKNRDYDGISGSFLGDMLHVRDKFEQKETLTEEDKKYDDWSTIYVATNQKGSFSLAGNGEVAEYAKRTETYYTVNQADDGYYNAKLTDLNFFDKYTYLKQKDNNINAWFYPEKQSNAYTAFSDKKYTVGNVVKNSSNTGDYDYDRLNDLFTLNKGKGAYDVWFMPYEGKKNQQVYHMSSAYQIVDDHSGEYTGSLAYYKANDSDMDGRADGHYNQVTNEHYVFVGPNQGGQYVWKQDGNGTPQEVYKKCYWRQGVEYVNMEWFKHYALKLDESEWDDFKIEVITRTPQEVNTDLSLIDRADLVFLSPSQQNLAYVGLWEFYGKDTKEQGVTDSKRYTCGDLANNGVPANIAGLKQGKTLPTFIGNDLNWEATYQLFQRIGVKQDLPTVLNCLMYEGVPTDVAGSNNCYKLYLMLRQWNPQIFNDKFFEKNKEKIIKGTYNTATTGEYTEKVGKARFVWNQNTFLPTVPNGMVDVEAYYKSVGIDNYNLLGNQSTVDNIYTFYNDPKLGKEFVEDNYTYDNWFRQAKEFIYEEENGEGGTDQEIAQTPLSTADILHYLLQYKKPTLQKAKIVVLDLEPCYDVDNLTVDRVKSMLNGYTGDVEIVHMSTSEFNGKLEDLNREYDMIYMGLSIAKFNTRITSDGKKITNYNDDLLDGKIYLHVGDRIIGGNALRGLVDNLSTYRFSGNDITKGKQAQLLEYIKAGYPIVMENDLYTCNTDRIDAYSNVYSFANSMTTKYKNIMNSMNFDNLATKSKATNTLIKYTSIEKPKMNFTKEPQMYDGNNPTVLMSERKLTFEFSIADLKAEKNSLIDYTIKLYIDSNADGRYMDSELSVVRTGEKAGKTISFVKTLPKSYVGVIPWKLVVYRTNNPYIRSSEIGYYAIKRTEAEKKELKILQVTSTKYSSYNWTGSTMNLQDELRNKNSKFYKYGSNLNDFILNIKTMDVNAFANLYSGSTGSVSNAYKKDDPNTIDRLSGYDMLIFGFGDSYTDISNKNGALDNVFAFIESGKSVLFTHDTTSIVNREVTGDTYSKGVLNWGYSINQYLRDRIGMNRFGVKTKAQQSDLDNLKNKDIAYSPTGTKYSEIQGYSMGALMAFGVSPADDEYEYNNYCTINNLPKVPSSQLGPFKDINIRDTRNESFADISTIRTYSVSNVNKGQITEYPYKIPNTVNTAETHSQYYELDLEDREIVVWYCLSNNTGLFKASPNDVRNNYYIYNKGNITYTGAGHRSFSNNDDEIKLFINTMVAAYRASLSAPEITVTNGYDNEAGVSFVYSDCDFSENDKTSTPEDKVRISFTVKDDSIVSDTSMISIYDGDGNKLSLPVYDEDENIVPENKVKTYSKNSNGELYQYYVLYPKEKLDKKESTNLKIIADNTKIKSTKLVTLIRRNLFNLH